MEHGIYEITTGSGTRVGVQAAKNAETAVVAFKAWHPEYQWHELAAVESYRVPVDPAEDTQCDSCQ